MAGATTRPMPVAKEATVTSPAAPRAVGGELGLGPLQLGEDRVGVAEQDLAGGGQPYAPAAAVEQAVARLLLQRGELLGDGRGGEVQRGGRGGHRTVVGHRTQDAQPPRVDHARPLSPASRADARRQRPSERRPARRRTRPRRGPRPRWSARRRAGRGSGPGPAGRPGRRSRSRTRRAPAAARPSGRPRPRRRS